MFNVMINMPKSPQNPEHNAMPTTKNPKIATKSATQVSLYEKDKAKKQSATSELFHGDFDVSN